MGNEDTKEYNNIVEEYCDNIMDIISKYITSEEKNEIEQKLQFIKLRIDASDLECERLLDNLISARASSKKYRLHPHQLKVLHGNCLFCKYILLRDYDVRYMPRCLEDSCVESPRGKTHFELDDSFELISIKDL